MLIDECWYFDTCLWSMLFAFQNWIKGKAMKSCREKTRKWFVNFLGRWPKPINTQIWAISPSNSVDTCSSWLTFETLRALIFESPGFFEKSNPPLFWGVRNPHRFSVLSHVESTPILGPRPRPRGPRPIPHSWRWYWGLRLQASPHPPTLQQPSCVRWGIHPAGWNPKFMWKPWWIVDPSIFGANRFVTQVEKHSGMMWDVPQIQKWHPQDDLVKKNC